MDSNESVTPQAIISLKDMLSEEAMRLIRINNMLEKAFPKTQITYREPELIKDNVRIIIEIYELLVE